MSFRKAVCLLIIIFLSLECFSSDTAVVIEIKLLICYNEVTIVAAETTARTLYDN